MNRLTRAVPADLDRILNFQKKAFARTEAVIGAPAIPLEWDYRDVLRDCEVWLHEEDGKLAGVLILRLLENQLYLQSIATDPDHAGSGVGRRLMAITFERARSASRERVGLITNQDNPAAGWYRRLGFLVDFEEVQNDRIVLHMSASVISASGERPDPVPGQTIEERIDDTMGASDDRTA